MLQKSITTMNSETLYNGIQLPEIWPERLSLDSLSEPHSPVKPPSIIQIDTGRQLFVDDFLIEKTGLKRTFHKPELFSSNPVVFPEKDWEKIDNFSEVQCPTAMVFSDGVWYDPQDNLFKMWYIGGFMQSTCYAISQDGVNWEKPVLDVVAGTNIVHNAIRDSSTVWLDLEEKDQNRRYKLFVFEGKKADGNLSVYFSPDGVHWSEKILETGNCGDRSTVFYNPFRKKWVYSLRDFIEKGPGRIRRYYETDDIITGSIWNLKETAIWTGADNLDFIRQDLKIPCQLYNLDCVAYESVLLGFFSIWRGHPPYRHKINEICTGFSRDGFHWYRPDRTPFVGVSERYGDWNWCNIQSAGGCCFVVNDKLYFYFSGRAGIKGRAEAGISSTGLATLRRDGFVSMDAGDKEETLTTRKLVLSKKFFFVNADVKENGFLKVEILDSDGRIIQPFSKENCIPVLCNSTSIQVKWQNVEDLSDISGKPIKIRFYLKNCRLYSFWVSKDISGPSDGFIAAGGPGFETNRDT